MNNQYESILQALDGLRKRGFDQNFRLSSSGLNCSMTTDSFNPDDLKIVEFHRFEGESNMEDMAIIYAIEASPSCKGVLIDAYGTYGNSELENFIRKIPISREKSNL